MSDTHLSAAGRTKRAPVDFTKPWFALMEDDKQEGPFTFSALHDHIRSGRVTPESLIWQPGMPDWAPAGELPQLNILWGDLGGLPPPPAAVAPPVPTPFPRAAIRPGHDASRERVAGPWALVEAAATTQPDAGRSSVLGPIPHGRTPANPSELAAFLFADLSQPRVEPKTDVRPGDPRDETVRSKSVREEPTMRIPERPSDSSDRDRTAVAWLPWTRGRWALRAAGLVAFGAVAGTIAALVSLR